VFLFFCSGHVLSASAANALRRCFCVASVLVKKVLSGIVWFTAALTCMLLLTAHTVSSGNETATAGRCEEEEHQTLQAGEDQTACMAEADLTALMDQEDEPAWREEEDQTDTGEQGEGPKTEEEGPSTMAEQDQTALVNDEHSHGQDIGEDKGKCQEGTLDKEEDDRGKCQAGTLDKEEDGKGRGNEPMEEEDKEAEGGSRRGDQLMEEEDKEEEGKGRGDQPMEEEDKEVEDEPEELVDGKPPSRLATLIRQSSTPPDLTTLTSEHL